MFKPAFKPEPPFTHGQAPRTAVLLCNLGTPDEPTAPAVRRYLAEFLGDHRVVEIPRLVWMAILHGIILRVRPAKSAAKYATIWTNEGSPLKIWTDKQAQALQEVFNTHGEHVTKLHIILYTIIMILITLLPYLTGMSGPIYLLAAIVLGLGFLWWSLVLMFKPKPSTAMDTFQYSIVYLMVLFIVLLTDHYL